MMDMSIYTRILKESDAFMLETGKAPKYVYLGKDEWHDIEILSKALALFETPPVDQYRMICGLRSFVVDAENHLGVGI